MILADKYDQHFVVVKVISEYRRDITIWSVEGRYELRYPTEALDRYYTLVTDKFCKDDDGL